MVDPISIGTVIWLGIKIGDAINKLSYIGRGNDEPTREDPDSHGFPRFKSFEEKPRHSLKIPPTFTPPVVGPICQGPKSWGGNYTGTSKAGYLGSSSGLSELSKMREFKESEERFARILDSEREMRRSKRNWELRKWL